MRGKLRAAIVISGWLAFFLGHPFPMAAAPAGGTGSDLNIFRTYFKILENGGPVDEVLDRSTWPDNADLISYLELELLLHPRNEATIPDLLHFLERWPDHAQKKLIAKRVETRLTESMDEKSALAWFDAHPPVSTAARTFYVQLLLQKNRIPEALPLWKDLYLAGMVLPKDLASKTSEFEKGIGIGDQEKRARNLIKNGSHETLRVFLQGFPENRRYYFLALDAATRGDEKSFARYREHLSKRNAHRSELWYAYIEWLRSHGSRAKAYAMLTGPEGRHLNTNDRYVLRYRLAKYLEDRDHLFDALELPDLHDGDKGTELEDALWLAAWTAHRLKHDKRSLKMFELLGEQAKSGHRRSQGAWWAAMLSKSKSARKKWLNQAAKFPDTFYGLLALETRDNQLPDLRTSATNCDIIHDARLQGDLQRMFWLRDMGRSHYNGLEAETIAQRFQLGIAEHLCLAVHSGAFDYAIRLAQEMRRSGHHYWQGLYPMPHWVPASGWQLDPALIWGMTKQESLFDTRSKSSAQARGLLQIIPSTAEEEAKLSSFPPPDPELIYEPAYNLALGQAYMKRMLSAFDGDLVLALCSYNAGPGRGEKWREQRRSESAVEFIENIPFNETRAYVKLVLNGFVHYQLLMYGKGSILSIINPGAPGLQKLLLQGIPFPPFPANLPPSLQLKLP
ncbi:MAG: lytic transglycosylase domain-containing protein [Magnetococcales bacterium]|nr:lytic transglycosylase domain-containing protein [Magnetococcales bacterium]